MNNMMMTVEQVEAYTLKMNERTMTGERLEYIGKALQESYAALSAADAITKAKLKEQISFLEMQYQAAKFRLEILEVL